MMRNLVFLAALLSGLMMGGAMVAGKAQAQGTVESFAEDAVLLYFFNRADLNKDGVVSEDEFEYFFEDIFDAADTDHNERLSVAEVMQQKERERAAMVRVLTGKGR
jgi:hypothetical protein